MEKEKPELHTDLTTSAAITLYRSIVGSIIRIFVKVGRRCTADYDEASLGVDLKSECQRRRRGPPAFSTTATCIHASTCCDVVD